MDISVIIVSWNTKDLLRQCLLSVVSSTERLEHEIYVVDNASTDGSADMVRDEFSEVILIANDSNLGFAAANNQALRLARAKYVLLLNPDTILSQDCLAQLYTFAEQNTQAGAVGAKRLNPDGSCQGWSRGNFPTRRRLFNHAFFLSRLFPRSRFFEGHTFFRDPAKPVEADWVAGTCVLLRREALEDVGLLNEEIFMYGEDVELCWRLKQAGWKVYYHGRAILIHYGSQSFLKQDDSLLRTKLMGWSISRGSHGGHSFVDRIIIISGLLLRLGIQSLLCVFTSKYERMTKWQQIYKTIRSR